MLLIIQYTHTQMIWFTLYASKTLSGLLLHLTTSK